MEPLMEVDWGLTIAVVTMSTALFAAGIAGGLAYGYRNARDTERAHNTYLREQIARLMPTPGPGGPVMARGAGVRVVEGSDGR
jgi:hypothetical protein